MTNKPFFSIVIPALNEEKYLPKLLADLTKQTYQDFEVIVVDGASDDKTVENTKKFKSKLPLLSILTSKIRNVSIQRNMGGNAAVGEYIVFNDADNNLPTYFLEGLRYKIHSNSTDLFTCWSETSFKDNRDKTVTTASNLLIEANFLAKTPIAYGSMIGCKRNIFLKTPMFNPEVGFAEDTDFVRSAVEMGYSFKVFHDPRYIYSLRRFHSQGTLKVIQKSAKLFIKYLSGQNIDQKSEYPMGGHHNTSKNKDLLEKINNFLNKPIKKPKIIEQLQSLLKFED